MMLNGRDQQLLQAMAAFDLHPGHGRLERHTTTRLAEALGWTRAEVETRLKNLRRKVSGESESAPDPDSILHLRPGTRAMIADELDRLARACSGGRGKAELQDRLRTVAAWVETL